MTIFIRTLFICTISVLASSANADDIAYNQITFSEYANQEVENDVLVAEMYAQKEGHKPNFLAKDVNSTIDNALKIIKKHPNIRVQTLNYRTHPVYHKSKVVRWKVQQTIRLESRNSKLLGGVIGELQNSLALQSVSYKVSDEALRTHNLVLTEKAISRFRSAAKTITNAMGRSSYRVVNMSINQAHSQNNQGPVMYRATAAKMVGDAATLRGGTAEAHVQLEATNMEAGKRDIRVTVHGTIEISNN